MSPNANEVRSLHIVYDADGTTTGEIVYMVKKFLGLAHCAACDITHGPRREKPEFTRMKNIWPVPLLNIHRDEMDGAMAATVAGVLPCVVARTQLHDVLLLTPEQLELCGGDVARLQEGIYGSIEACGLAMPEKAPTCARIQSSPGNAMEKRESIPMDREEDLESESSVGDSAGPETAC